MATEPIKPGDLCMVVRNITGHPCIEANLGRPVEVSSRHLVMLAFYGLSFVWALKTPHVCLRCGETINAHFEGDLQPIRGTGQALNQPAQRPVEEAAS